MSARDDYPLLLRRNGLAVDEQARAALDEIDALRADCAVALDRAERAEADADRLAAAMEMMTANPRLTYPGVLAAHAEAVALR